MTNTDAHKTMGGDGVNPRRSMPYNPYAMAVAAGIAVVGGVWYMYNRNKKAEARHRAPESDDTRRPK
ncbi:hypothetical protein ACS0TY_022367 [Phlomoides rotata]